MTVGLFIGRFQPFHKGHLLDVQHAQQECDRVIIAIGSAQEKGTFENPYSYEQRKEMILLCLPQIPIIPIDDVNNDQQWVNNILLQTPNIDIVYTGNDRVQRIFEQYTNIKVKRVDILEGINSTKIRTLMKENKEWQSLVPKEVYNYITQTLS